MTESEAKQDAATLAAMYKKLEEDLRLRQVALDHAMRVTPDIQPVNTGGIYFQGAGGKSLTAVLSHADEILAWLTKKE